MKDVCALNLEADVVAQAMRAELPEAELVRLREHFASCEHCASTARALERVKLAWTDAVAETPIAERARDAHAMRRFVERASNSRRKAFGAGLVIGLAAAAAITLVVVRRSGGEVAAVTKPAASTALSSNREAAANAFDAPASPAVPPVTSARRAARDGTQTGLVVLAACGTCRSATGDLGAGVILVPRERVDVPAGAELRLAFSLSEAVADSHAGVSVEGPAEVANGDDGVLLDRGRARVSTASHAIVRTPHVVASSDSARWIVESGPHGTRVDVLSGRVAVTSSSGGTVASIAAGEHVTFDEHGGRLAETNGAKAASALASATEQKPAPLAGPTAAAPSTTSAPLPSGRDHWSAARDALDRGDRLSAESELRALLASSADEALSRRAAFMLAELELARGASASGRLRLDELVHGGDPQIAEDAAALLARSYKTADERARVWSSYVATSPPSPRRERAMLEQARALVAAGKRDEAKSVASRLCEASSPADVCRASRDLL